MTFNGTSITARVDGAPVAAVTNAARSTGQVGIGISGWQTQEFADLRITPVGGSGTATTLVNAATGR
jgi:hypothetical protein